MSAFPCGKITHSFLVMAGLVLSVAAAQAGSFDQVKNGDLTVTGGDQGEPVLELLDFNQGDVYAQDLSAIDGNIIAHQAILAAGAPERFPPFEKPDGIALLAFVAEGKESSVPEPTTWLVLATGLVLVCFARLAPMANPARRARSYIAWRWRWRWPWRARSRSRSRWPGRVK